MFNEDKIKKLELEMVCSQCGHYVTRCGNESSCEKFYGEPQYFCGNCGEYGSHQRAVKISNWVKARKLLGLSTKINSFD